MIEALEIAAAVAVNLAVLLLLLWLAGRRMRI
jgi:hypothetical protein